MLYNPLTLSHYFVRKGSDAQVPISAHQAEFMVYFAHGWHLAINGRPLIEEKIKAWRHGPVIESVHKFYFKIKSDIRMTVDENVLHHIKESDKDFLDGIWHHYSHLNEMQMLSLCTAEDTPWHEADHVSAREVIIEDRVIKRHYSLLHVSNPDFWDMDDPISVAS